MQDHNKLTSRRRKHRADKAIQFGLMVSFEFLLIFLSLYNMSGYIVECSYK